MSRQTTLARFEAKFIPEPNSGCWLWTAFCFWDGYGCFRAAGRLERAHRVAWTLYVGPISDDLCVLHRCDVPSCVNPAHLFLGTKADNAADRDAKGRHKSGVVLGDRNGSRLHPERLARGDRNGSKTHPEGVRRGEENGKAKLSEKDILDIRDSASLLHELSGIYGVTMSTLSKIRRRQAWIHIPERSVQ